MKKFISLFLVIAICLSFAACGNTTATESTAESATEKQSDKHTAAVVGVWKSTSFYMLTFNEDNTGTFLQDGQYNDFTWNYDKNLSCYVVASASLLNTLNIFLKNENGINYLECSNSKLYRDEDFDDILDQYLEKCRAELSKEFSFDTTSKIEFKKPYSAGDLSITFTELLVENDEFNLYVKITNNGSTSLDSVTNELLYVGYKHKYYAPPSEGFGLGIGFDFSFVDNITTIAPGETAVLKAKIAGGRIISALTVFETIVGAATCSIDGNLYYIDLGEYTIK